jgi:hypothetical protein
VGNSWLWRVFDRVVSAALLILAYLCHIQGRYGRAVSKEDYNS